jgi:2-oxoglutarate ferredoxin oxidoreductase subunit beta
VHGRTLPWATGIKLHNPNLKVVIFAGDGDAVAIGGNHLIQAARRNLDVTMIVVNNLNFGMTGGQAAPTTLQHFRTTTTPFGNVEKPFDICQLAITAGATFVSRWSPAKPLRAIKSIKNALQHVGFSLVEIICQCPTNFGRAALSTGDAVKMLDWIKESSLTVKQATELSSEEKAKRFVLGDFVDRKEPVFAGSSVQRRKGGA